MKVTKLIAGAAFAALIFVSGCGPAKESPAGATPVPAASTKLPFGFLNTPAEGQAVKLDPAKPVFATGWALADSGVADISAVFDDGQTAYVKMGFFFPGVKEQFPSYADADKAGYMFGIPKLAPGSHSVKVTVKAKDGGTTQIERHFSVS